MPKYIIYRTYKNRQAIDRKVTVIDGEPFYQSTGRNSENPGRWFPFLMLIGTEREDCTTLPHPYDVQYLNGFMQAHIYPRGHLIKASLWAYQKPFRQSLEKSQPVSSEDKGGKVLSDGIPLKKQWIISERLSRGEDSRRTTQEAEETQLPLTLEPYSDNPVYEDPDDVNQWLAEQGAIIAKAVLPTGFIVAPIDKLKKDLQTTYPTHDLFPPDKPVQPKKSFLQTCKDGYSKLNGWKKTAFWGGIIVAGIAVVAAGVFTGGAALGLVSAGVASVALASSSCVAGVSIGVTSGTALSTSSFKNYYKEASWKKKVAIGIGISLFTLGIGFVTGGLAFSSIAGIGIGHAFTALATHSIAMSASIGGGVVIGGPVGVASVVQCSTARISKNMGCTPSFVEVKPTLPDCNVPTAKRAGKISTPHISAVSKHKWF